ncbi:MAG: LamG domain-containing protein [Kiritimatiellae bacterium]|nr:LamG domain-containing protein [Kiritimatiellia bacterium]
MKKILSAIAVATSAVLTALAALDPDCVLYYDFETLAEDGYKVENIANPGVMQLDGKRLSLANVVEATPSAKIRQTRAAVPADDSSHTLRYVQEGEVYDGRYCTPPEGTDYFATTNFTIELFYKIDGSVAAWHSMFKRFGANNVQVNLGVGGANKLSAQVMTGEVSSSYETKTINDSQVTNDDKWHHAALVVDQTGETKTMRLYRDYKLIGTQELATNLTSVVRGGDQKWYVIGSGDKYEFNGWLDSVRVTLRALEPQEFLWGEGMSIGRFPAGSTLAHVKFDGSINAADPDGGTFLNGVNVAAKDGGSPATFSDDVPGARIVDGEGGVVLSKNNTKSLYFANSRVSWSDASDIYYLSKTLAGEDRTSWTVEFFMKADSEQAQWARIMSALGGGSWNAWSPYIIEAKSTPVRFFLCGLNGKPQIRFNTDVCDGKWHHVAFSFEPNNDRPDPTNSVAKLYIDYDKFYAEAQTPNIFKYPENLHFVLGGVGQSTDTGYFGLIDELRISDGALTPDKFLRAEKKAGFILIVK